MAVRSYFSLREFLTGYINHHIFYTVNTTKTKLRKLFKMGSFNFNPEKATQEVSDLFLFSTKYGGLKVINQSNLKVINHFKDTDST